MELVYGLSKYKLVYTEKYGRELEVKWSILKKRFYANKMSIIFWIFLICKIKCKFWILNLKPNTLTT